MESAVAPGKFRTRIRVDDVNDEEQGLHSEEQAVETDNGSCTFNKERMIAVRYFLDRPGYGLHNSAVRLWFEPPSPVCRPNDVLKFLESQRIALDGLLVEVYLDCFQSFMLLDACAAAGVEWDFQDISLESPGILNVRLTDTTTTADVPIEGPTSVNLPTASSSPNYHQQATVTHQQPSNIHSPPEIANTTPIAVFAFSFLNGLEATNQLRILVPDSIPDSFALTWGPFMVAMGLIQVLAASFQVFRGNVYGAVAFMGFGGIWAASGFKEVLIIYFGGNEPAASLIESAMDDPDVLGHCIRQLYVLAFSVLLLLQTLRINRLSTSVITLLCLKLLFSAFSGYSTGVRWVYFVLAWLTSFMAFYVSLVEMTNQVYHKRVFRTFKWHETESPEETFGAAGQSHTLYSRAMLLRNANFPNVHTVRSAMESPNTNCSENKRKSD